MSEKTTKVAGYYNPHQYPIRIDISDLNLRFELPPGKYIKDTSGNILNDPVFEPYVHAKGLGRATTDVPVPLRFVPKPTPNAPARHIVNEAKGFVRQPDGRVTPTFAPQPQETPLPTANRTPHQGMSVEEARRRGFIGKPRLVPEDYGADETSGAPNRNKNLPPVRVSVESPPRVNTLAPLPEGLMQPDDKLTPAQAAHRASLQKAMNTAAARPSGDEFDPTRVKKPAPPTTATTVAPAPAPAKPVKPAPAPAAPQPKRLQTVAVPPPPEPEPEAVAAAEEFLEESPEQQSAAAVEESDEVVDIAPVTIEPGPAAQEVQPVPQNPQNPEKSGRFVCIADGKNFQYRSQLERHVRKKYPSQLEPLMAAYPAE